MRDVQKSGLKNILLILGIMFIGFSCTQYKIPTDVASCEGCHTNKAYLKEVYTKDTTEAVGGCGGGAIVIPPYDRVYMGDPGYTAFKADPAHGSLTCTSCHNGVDGTFVKDEAHSGKFLKHPSEHHMEKCDPCHSQQAELKDISSNFMYSLHNGTGQKRKVTMRMGLDGAHQFDQLPEHQIEGYNTNCATCHGTCGNCHVVRPPVAGGGLMNGHKFVKNTSWRNVCVKCHTSRGGHAYLGEAPGTERDVHLDSLDWGCMDCHTGYELHGNGDSTVSHRYAYSELPSCTSTDCHVGIESSNLFHEEHWGEFNCHVCHSQDYNNCGSCHIHGDGARIASYQGFKIARNPIQEERDFEFVLVRRTPSAPDSWEKYGVNEYPNFDAFPTYNFTTPHNILKVTSRTDTTAARSVCWTKCHIRTEGESIVNKELYLFESDLLDWELSASSDIVVNGALPGGWPN